MTSDPIKILLQTTIPTTEDDWSIARFGRLGAFLAGERHPDGRPVFAVTMRDRDPLGAPDSVLSALDNSGFDEMWLFAVDVGDGLTPEDCEAITRFRRNGGGLLVTRDHMDLGSSICTLGGVGKAHHFHSRNLDPDVANHEIDDPYSTNISWPNFHSGANGDFQEVEVVGPIHPVMADPASPTRTIRFLPSHPHEGAVSAPENEPARVIATGVSKVTGRKFNIAVTFEPDAKGGLLLRKAPSIILRTIIGTQAPVARALSMNRPVMPSCARRRPWRTRIDICAMLRFGSQGVILTYKQFNHLSDRPPLMVRLALVAVRNT